MTDERWWRICSKNTPGQQSASLKVLRLNCRSQYQRTAEDSISMEQIIPLPTKMKLDLQHNLQSLPCNCPTKVHVCGSWILITSYTLEHETSDKHHFKFKYVNISYYDQTYAGSQSNPFDKTVKGERIFENLWQAGEEKSATQYKRKQPRMEIGGVHCPWQWHTQIKRQEKKDTDKDTIQEKAAPEGARCPPKRPDAKDLQASCNNVYFLKCLNVSVCIFIQIKKCIFWNCKYICPMQEKAARVGYCASSETIWRSLLLSTAPLHRPQCNTTVTTQHSRAPSQTCTMAK